MPFTPLNDGLRQLAFSESGASLHSMFDDGVGVIRDGRLTGINEEATRAEMAEKHRHLEPPIARCEIAVQRLAPSYRRIWDRCLGVTITGAT